jgi:hypothetical protein
MSNPLIYELFYIAPSALPPGTIAYWPLTANGNDTGPNGYNLTNNGSTTFQTIAGNLCAGEFTASKNFTPPSAFFSAISAGASTGVFQFTFNIYMTAFNAQFDEIFNCFAGWGPGVFFEGSGGGGQAGELFLATNTGSAGAGSNVLLTNTWYQIKCRFNLGVGTLLINGTQVLSFTYTDAAGSPTDFVIGYSSPAGGWPLEGYLYNFSVTNQIW